MLACGFHRDNNVYHSDSLQGHVVRVETGNHPHARILSAEGGGSQSSGAIDPIQQRLRATS
jgi:hypothetical protein